MSGAAQPIHVPHGLEPEDAKTMVRKAVRAARENRPARRRQEAAAGFVHALADFEHLRGARCVAAYVSRPAEPGTLPLLEDLALRGVKVLLPVLGPGLERDWAPFAGADDLLERAPGRPPEPGTEHLGAAALAEADVIIAPALAVDTSGARLGQGGGWYDRALGHKRPDAKVVALVFPEEIYDAADSPIPTEPHDVPVDAFATPSGWRWADRRGA